MKNDFNDILNAEDLKNNPFQVPEGYFETLNARILANAGIEQKKEKKTSRMARILAMRPVRWAAACVCVLVITATAYLATIDNKDDMMASSPDNEFDYNPDDAFNKAADYTMFDSNDMYMMLAEE